MGGLDFSLDERGLERSKGGSRSGQSREELKYT